MRKPANDHDVQIHDLLESSQPSGRLKVKPNLHVVSNNSIFEEVGLTHPNQVNPHCQKDTESNISNDHKIAIDDVEKFLAGVMTRTDLSKKYALTYTNWKNMKQRSRTGHASGAMLDPVFDEFFSFLRIMGPRPYKDASLDRLNPEGPYTPANLRWASKQTQSRNRTNTVFLECKGEKLPLVEWATRLGVHPDTLRARKRNEWTDTEIIEGKSHFGGGEGTRSPSYSRSIFDYTPWPQDQRETWERRYQRFGQADEHRIEFMLRYGQEQLDIADEEGQAGWFPDDYQINIKEAGIEQNLLNQFRYWKKIVVEATRLLNAQEHSPHPYNRRCLPESVEDKLSAYR